MDLRLPRDRSSRAFRTIRKHALTICFIETLTIVLFLAYVFLPNYTNNNTISKSEGPLLKQFSNNQDEFTSNNYRTYSNGVNSSKILVGLVDGCNQRKHDLQFSVKCESREADTCFLSPTNNNVKIAPIHPSSLSTIITSSKSGLRLFSQQVPLKKIKCRNENDNLAIGESCRLKTQLHVFTNVKEQEIIGWGGALTDSSINNILSLTTNGTRKLLDEYFSTDGLMFNIIRITIGGSDFSSRFYTNDDLEKSNKNEIENGTKKDDLKLENFRLKEEDLLYKIPMLKYILNEYDKTKREMKIFASMWSPPTWMKTNEHYNKGQLKGSISTKANTDDELYFNALAELKKKFILAYKENDIDIWGLTVMNEPIFSIQPFLDFNTMIFPRDDYANYIAKYLGPAIKQDERLKNIKLIVHDDNRRFLMNFTDPILSMERVRTFVDGISVHGYIDEDYALMSEIYEKYKASIPNLFILPTELCSGHLPFMEKALIGNWHRGVHYALDIIHSLQHSAAGWVDWNMVLDTTGGPGWLGGKLDSPIIVDKDEDSYHKSPMFYILGHFSKYIPPHSFKLKTKLFNDLYDYRFETVTFILPNGKDMVTVVLNQNPYPIEFNIRIIDQEANRADENHLQQVVCKSDSVTTIIYSKLTS